MGRMEWVVSSAACTAATWHNIICLPPVSLLLISLYLISSHLSPFPFPIPSPIAFCHCNTAPFIFCRAALPAPLLPHAYISPLLVFCACTRIIYLFIAFAVPCALLLDRARRGRPLYLVTTTTYTTRVTPRILLCWQFCHSRLCAGCWRSACCLRTSPAPPAICLLPVPVNVLSYYLPQCFPIAFPITTARPVNDVHRSDHTARRRAGQTCASRRRAAFYTTHLTAPAHLQRRPTPPGITATAARCLCAAATALDNTTPAVCLCEHCYAL